MAWIDFAICIKKKKVQVRIFSAEVSCGCSGRAFRVVEEEEVM